MKTKWLSILIAAGIMYVIRHDATQDVAVQFKGLSVKAISDMYVKDGVSFNFVSEKTYLKFLADQKAQLEANKTK